MKTRSQFPIKPISKPSLTPGKPGFIQRKCACGNSANLTGKCNKCQNKRLSLQRYSTNQTKPDEIPPIVQEVLRSSGQPLDENTRTFMETRFDYNFRPVRVHTDLRAAESARAVNALAYTVGKNIVFAPRQYQPETSSGKRLLAHELTHTIQQQMGNVTLLQKFSMTDEDEDSLEKEAEQLADETEITELKEKQPTSKIILRREIFTDNSRRWVSPSPGFRVKSGSVVVDTLLKYKKYYADRTATRYYVGIYGTAKNGEEINGQKEWDVGKEGKSIFNVPAGQYQIEVGVYNGIIDDPFYLEVSITWRS